MNVTVSGLGLMSIITVSYTHLSVEFIEITPANEVLVEDDLKLADKIEALSKSLKGKAIKARGKLESDIDKLRQEGHLNCLDKYLPLIYKSNGIDVYKRQSLPLVYGIVA